MSFKGSGLFKAEIQSALEAEIKAILNALTIVKMNATEPIVKIIINRDNLGAKAVKDGNEGQRALYELLEGLKSIHKGSSEFYEFRHVNAHKHTRNARHWVNDWCDKQCTMQLNNFKANL